MLSMSFVVMSIAHSTSSAPNAPAAAIAGCEVRQDINNPREAKQAAIRNSPTVLLNNKPKSNVLPASQRDR